MKRSWLLVAIIAAYVSLPLATINVPFLRHRESSMTEQGKLARNFNKFGISTLRCGPLDVSGPNLESYDNWRQYYLTNRQVIPLMLFAVDFSILGVSEWSMRLLMLVIGIASILTFYKIAGTLLPLIIPQDQRNFADRYVLVAVAAYALNASFWYFSTVANAYAMTLLAVQICLICYLKWVETPTARRYFLIVVTFFIACNVGWPAYYLGMVFAAHSLFLLKRNRILSAFFVVLPFLFFGLHLLHIYMLDPETGSIIGRMGAIVSERSTLSGPGIFEYAASEFREVAMYFTVIVCCMSVAGIWFCARHFNETAGLALLLSLIGLEEILFARWAFNHDYFTYVLAPFFAITAAVGLSFFCTKFRKLSGVGITIFSLLFIGQASYFAVNRYTQTGGYAFYYELAGAINKETSPNDKLLILTDNLPLYTPFYADRYMVSYSWKEKTLSPECRGPAMENVSETDLLSVIERNQFRMNFIVAADLEYSRSSEKFLKTLPDNLVESFGVLRNDGAIFRRLQEMVNRGALTEKRCDGFIFYKYN